MAAGRAGAGRLLTAPLRSSRPLRRAPRRGLGGSCRRTWTGAQAAHESSSQPQWVLLFNKELVPEQIVSLRILQKASYSTQGKSLSSHDGSKACRIRGPLRQTPLTSHDISPTPATPASLLSSNVPGVLSPLGAHTCCSPTGTLFSQILIRVARSLTSFCPYPNVTIPGTPSPDATPKLTSHPPPHTLPILFYSPNVLQFSPRHTSHPTSTLFL